MFVYKRGNPDHRDLLYPPPGHRSCVIPGDQVTVVPLSVHTKRRCRAPDSEATSDTSTGIQQILTLGGAIRYHDKLWKESSRPVISSFKILEDIVADDSYMPNLTGAELPGLDHPGMISVWEESKVVVWGGEVVWSRGGGLLKKSRDLFELRTTRHRGKLAFDVTKYAEPGKLAPSRQNRPTTEQKGNIPQARSAHTFLRVGDTKKALMFGGATLGPQRTRGAAVLLPKEECSDSSIYLLDLDEYQWTDTGPVNGLTPRCYHASCFARDISPFGTVIMVGGKEFVGDRPTHKLPITTIDMIHINDLDNHMFSVEKIAFDVEPKDVLYVTMAACAYLPKEHKVFVFGGHSQATASIEVNTKQKTSDAMYCFNVTNNTVTVRHLAIPSLFRITAGATLLPMTDDVILIAGGSAQQYGIYKTRELESQTKNQDRPETIENVPVSQNS